MSKNSQDQQQSRGQKNHRSIQCDMKEEEIGGSNVSILGSIFWAWRCFYVPHLDGTGICAEHLLVSGYGSSGEPGA